MKACENSDRQHGQVFVLDAIVAHVSMKPLIVGRLAIEGIPPSIEQCCFTTGRAHFKDAARIRLVRELRVLVGVTADFPRGPS